MTDAQLPPKMQITPNYFSGEVGLPLMLVPYGAWRLIIGGDHSWDAIILTVGPIALFNAVICHCIAIRRVAPWPAWSFAVVLLVAPLVEGAFVGYLLAYKAIGSLLQLRQGFSMLTLIAGCFYLWLAYDPLKAISLLVRKDVETALREQALRNPDPRPET